MKLFKKTIAVLLVTALTCQPASAWSFSSLFDSIRENKVVVALGATLGTACAFLGYMWYSSNKNTAKKPVTKDHETQTESVRKKHTRSQTEKPVLRSIETQTDYTNQDAEKQEAELRNREQELQDEKRALEHQREENHKLVQQLGNNYQEYQQALGLRDASLQAKNEFIAQRNRELERAQAAQATQAKELEQARRQVAAYKTACQMQGLQKNELCDQLDQRKRESTLARASLKRNAQLLQAKNQELLQLHSKIALAKGRSSRRTGRKSMQHSAKLNQQQLTSCYHQPQSNGNSQNGNGHASQVERKIDLEANNLQNIPKSADYYIKEAQRVIKKAKDLLTTEKPTSQVIHDFRRNEFIPCLYATGEVSQRTKPYETMLRDVTNSLRGFQACRQLDPTQVYEYLPVSPERYNAAQLRNHITNTLIPKAQENQNDLRVRTLRQIGFLFGTEPAKEIYDVFIQGKDAYDAFIASYQKQSATLLDTIKELNNVEMIFSNFLSGKPIGTIKEDLTDLEEWREETPAYERAVKDERKFTALQEAIKKDPNPAKNFVQVDSPSQSPSSSLILEPSSNGSQTSTTK